MKSGGDTATKRQVEKTDQHLIQGYYEGSGGAMPILGSLFDRGRASTTDGK